MTEEQLQKLLTLAQLVELHGKMGGTRPFDRLLAPISRELNALTDELDKEEQATQAKEKADVAAAAEAKRDMAERLVAEEEKLAAAQKAESEQRVAEATHAKVVNQRAATDIANDHADAVRRI